MNENILKPVPDCFPSSSSSQECCIIFPSSSSSSVGHGVEVESGGVLVFVPQTFVGFGVEVIEIGVGVFVDLSVRVSVTAIVGGIEVGVSVEGTTVFVGGLTVAVSSAVVVGVGGSAVSVFLVVGVAEEIPVGVFVAFLVEILVGVAVSFGCGVFVKTTEVSVTEGVSVFSTEGVSVFSTEEPVGVFNSRGNLCVGKARKF
jgi:hypothetical protein